MVATLQARDFLLRSVDRNWTADDWERLPHDSGYRFEIIYGVLYMSTAPHPFHQWVSRQAFLVLHEELDSRGLGITLTSPIGLFMPGSQPVQPDLLVLAPEEGALIREGRLETVPLLVVEILSPSNPEHDLVTKLELYANAGVPEYWVFRPVERDVIIHCDPDPVNGVYRRVVQVPPDGELISPTLPCRAAVARFFADPAIR
jgi:Uma2 family endonuclease